jgi:hypothetical protein
MPYEQPATLILVSRVFLLRRRFHTNQAKYPASATYTPETRAQNQSKTRPALSILVETHLSTEKTETSP